MKLQLLNNQDQYEEFVRKTRNDRLLNFSYGLEDYPPLGYPALLAYSVASNEFIQDWQYIYKGDFDSVLSTMQE